MDKDLALLRAKEAREAWASALVFLDEASAIVEIKQMMIDAMDAQEQTGIDAALTKALKTFEAAL